MSYATVEYNAAKILLVQLRSCESSLCKVRTILRDSDCCWSRFPSFVCSDVDDSDRLSSLTKQYSIKHLMLEKYLRRIRIILVCSISALPSVCSLLLSQFSRLAVCTSELLLFFERIL